MLVRELRHKPALWTQHRHAVRRRWLLPFHAFEWMLQWTSYLLGQWAFLEVLEYLGSLSVLVAVIFYFAETGDRVKQRHYQAWQVINTAQGKGGSGGRIEALHELNEDRIPLVGVDVSEAFLQGLELVKASLMRANLAAADLRNCNFRASNLRFANMHFTNLRGCDLTAVDFSDATLIDADFFGANLSGANLSRVDLTDADLSNTNLRGIIWQDMKAVDSANLYGVRNAPAGFVEWAMRHGAQSHPGE